MSALTAIWQSSYRRPSEFGPGSVSSSSLVAWGDASQLTGLVDGGAVSSWTDLSGLGHHAVQATGSLQPLYKVGVRNGRSVVRFDGSDDFLRVSFTLNQPAWAMIVANYRSGSGTNPTLVDGASSGNTGRVYFDGTNATNLNAGSNLGRTYTPTVWTVYTILINGGASSLNVNGGTATVGAAGAGNPGGLTLGATGGGVQPGQVDIGEFAYYASAPSAADQASLVTYARGKWAI